MARRLHIGGKTPSELWEILNAIPAPYVDHVCNANNLSQFSDNTFVEIYASHIVEHLDYVNELLATLKEWNRVLEPGGKLYISVPDMDTLAKLFIEKDKLSADERFSVMRMIFGGHVDKYDYHVVGLNDEFLAGFLIAAGFENIGIVKEGGFGLFEDTSSMCFKGVFISLNMIAEKPRGGGIPGKSSPESYQT
jgi:predicted SAM-dependent methyltransferase